METVKHKGRGTQINPPNRFERLHVENLPVNNEPGNDEELSERQIKTIFYKDDSKSVVSKNDSPDLYFNYSFNPFRGCEHGCIYCYARPTHEYLGFSPGIDFETKIMIKKNSPALLEEFFNKKNFEPEIIMFSGNTDCYQPIERKLQLTRKCLEVCLKCGNHVSIITKNSLILRDIDIIIKLAEKNLASVMLTITSLDNDLIRKMEPRTSIPERRLKAISELSINKIPVGVMIAPVIPGLNDEEIPKIIREASLNGAAFAGYTILRLPYAVKDLFINWLNDEFPNRANKVINRIKDIRGGKLNENEFGKRFRGDGEFADAIRNLFQLSCRKYNLNHLKVELTTEHFKRPTDSQLDMFGDTV